MMDLKLVPIEGSEELTLEERREQKKRSQRIDPLLLQQFTEADEVEIKQFLSDLIILIDGFRHGIEEAEVLEGHEDRLAALNEKRFALFQDLSNPLGRFVKLVGLAPVASEEMEILVKELRSYELRDHYRTKLETGVDLAEDNPFLMHMDDNIEVEHRDLEMKCRITPTEIEALINHFTLEDIVDCLITARKMITGEFWGEKHYDL